jgi:hypothetical protein
VKSQDWRREKSQSLGASSVLTEHRRHPLLSTARRKCWHFKFFYCFNLFLLCCLFPLNFSFLFFSFLYPSVSLFLQTVILMVYSTSFYYSQPFYPFAVPDNSTLLHNTWTISLRCSVLFIWPLTLHSSFPILFLPYLLPLLLLLSFNSYTYNLYFLTPYCIIQES